MIDSDEVIVVEIFDENGWHLIIYWVDHNGYMWIEGGRNKAHAIQRMRDKIKMTLKDKWLLEKYKESIKSIREIKKK